MKYIVIFLSLLFITSFAKPPVIDNVKASQRKKSSLIDINFDVDDLNNKLVYITLFGSSDNGITWDIQLMEVSGDTGLTTIGKGKHVVWDAKKDYTYQYSTNFKIKVLARDKICPNVGDEGMSFIGGGNYKLSKRDIFISEYCIDKWEFPNVKGAYPETYVTYDQAVDSCRSVGKELCTEAEWEFACAGIWNSTFPYGNNYSRHRCNTEGDSVLLIGDNKKCVSKYQVYDLSGNVFEWVSDWYNNENKNSTVQSEADIQYRSMRGGNYYLGEKFTKCSTRQFESPDYSNAHMGFRCCYSFIGR